MRTNLFRLLILVFICLVPLAACNQAEEAAEGVTETAAQVIEEDDEKTTDEGEGDEGQDGEDEDGTDEDAADEDGFDPEGEGYDETGTGDDQ